MANHLAREDLDTLPRLGWVQRATPVTELPDLADELGLSWIGVKRDDRCPELYGGSKVRKLDFVLASPRLLDAPEWVSAGAIGSGHLATLTAAAQELGRRLLAECFFQPPSHWVLDNLAFTASGPTRVRYHESRLGVALRHPGVLLARRSSGLPVVSPGASDVNGVLALVRAGLELAEQVRGGLLPAPDRVYVPLGSGGTAAGLSLGCALGGLDSRIHAVSAVERPFATASRLRSMIEEALDALERAGISIAKAFRAAPNTIDRSALGAGYGRPTEGSLRACRGFEGTELPFEPIYSGKAMAALRAAAPRGERVLFWLTPHRHGLPHATDWRDRLPEALQTHLRSGRRVGRRQVILAGGATAAFLFGLRVLGHDSVPSWLGLVLSEWEGAVIAAAAEALIPDVPGAPLPAGPSSHEVAVNVDRYVEGMSSRARMELHGMFVLLEHGTPLGGSLLRLTRLEPAERHAVLSQMMARTDEVGQAARGLRDLCYLGFYQDPRAWEALSYGGPSIRRAPGGAGRYAPLIAAEGAVPT